MKTTYDTLLDTFEKLTIKLCEHLDKYLEVTGGMSVTDAQFTNTVAAIDHCLSICKHLREIKGDA